MSGPPAGPAFCVDCGASLAAGARFCTNCGTSVDAETTVRAPGAWGCRTCGGDGSRLRQSELYCADCRWLRPLGPGYEMPAEAFIYDLDARAMAMLGSMAPLRSAAQALSNRIGRPWLESAVNGIRLGPDQLPHVFGMAIEAARIMGLPHMPEVYVSGEQMWDAVTLGSETDSFVVLGSVLNNFKDRDLLYLLGREMGHCAAGHALWRTVIQFMSGKRQFNRNIMGEGVMQFLNPAKIVESAIDAPLMAWARHSEITADRAGALVVGDEEVARRVATQWAMKSFPLFAQLNMAALERQIEEAADVSPLAEMTMSSTPYLGNRLRLARAFFRSEEYRGWRKVIDHWTAPPKPAAKPAQDVVRLNCIGCHGALSVPRSQFPPDGSALRVRCPNAACRKVMEVKPLPPRSAEIQRAAPDRPETIRLTCAACEGSMEVPRTVLAGKAQAYVRCPNKACGSVLVVRTPTPEIPVPAPPGQRQSPELLSSDG